VDKYKIIKSIITSIRTSGDIITVRETGRNLAKEVDFSNNDQTFIATAISEIARNIIEYAQTGEIQIDLVEKKRLYGIVITSKDEGPGIPDIKMALMDGYSTGKGMGMGLPGARRLMDDFNITSKVGVGTTVIMVKWKYSEGRE